MAESRQYTWNGVDRPIIPYKTYTSPIDTTPHYTTGSQNILTTSIGFAEKRPGFSNILGTFVAPPQRLYLWERWDQTIYLLASIQNGNTTLVQAINLTLTAQLGIANPQAFTVFSNTGSTIPFDFVVARNLLFFGNSSTAGTSKFQNPGSMFKWDGGGTGGAGTANVSGGVVTGGTVTNPGTGYGVAIGGNVTAYLIGGGGTGATAHFMAVGQVTSITLISGGNGYTGTPSVFIVGGAGSGATATATVSSGSVTAINITSTGTGYFAAPQIIILGGGGYGAFASANLVFGLKTFVVDTPGSGYTSAPTVIVDTGLAGTTSSGQVGVVTTWGMESPHTPPTFSFQPAIDGTATATQSGGVITSVTLTTAGFGYDPNNPPTVTINDPTGTGAIVIAVIDPRTFAISYFSIVSGGSGYTAPTVAIDPAGINAYTGYQWGYTWVTEYGHESNMSPLSINSSVFTHQVVTVNAVFNPVNGLGFDARALNLYRTTDGGSNNPQQMQLVNAIPSSPVTFTDTVADTGLQISTGPALFANTPPIPCGGFVYYNSRIWGFWNNLLFYSGAEEISNGVPEMAWPGFRDDLAQSDGNYQRWPQRVFGLGYTQDQLAVGTAGNFWQFSGDSLDTFRLAPLLVNRGVRTSTAINSVGNSVMWFDRSQQVWTSDQGEIGIDIRNDLLSVDPSQAFMGSHIQDKWHWIWLFDPAHHTLYIYDIDLEQWYTPWIIANSGCIVSGETSPGNPQLLMAIGSSIYALTANAYLDAGSQYSEKATLGLLSTLPEGDSVNRNRDLVGIVGQLEMETNGFQPVIIEQLCDDDPTAISSIWVTLSVALAPYRRPQGTALQKWIYKSEQTITNTERAAFRFTWNSGTSAWRMYGYNYNFKRSAQ